MLKPLQSLDLAENEHVSLLVTPATRTPGACQVDVEFTESLRSALQHAGPAPGLDEVRRRLSKIPGTLPPDFLAEREDRSSHGMDFLALSLRNRDEQLSGRWHPYLNRQRSLAKIEGCNAP
jgi:hypothetical protein